MICKIVAEKRKDLHSFVVEEIPLDCIIDKGSFLSTRRYLSDSSLWQVTEISSIHKHDGIEEDLGCTEFYGRDRKSVSFKVGDIVELASKGFVELAIVFELPAMREEILPALKEYYQGSDENRLGVFDDCYYIIDYSVAKDGKTNVSVRFADEDVWVTQVQLAEIYGTTRQNIGQHIDNIYRDDELLREATIKKFFIVQLGGAKRYKNFEFFCGKSPIACKSLSK